MIRPCLISFFAVAALVSLGAQDPVPFRGGTELVPIYVTVTDDLGRLVPDLRAEDFDVRDNGRRQPLAFFSSETQPFSAVVMLDRSGSMADHFDLIRDAASEFVTQMLPADRVRIGSFSNEIRMAPEDFTGDQLELFRILRDDLQEAGPSPVWTAIDRSVTALLPRIGRRVVLVFSDGHDDPGHGQVGTDLADVMRRVGIDEIMVYAIGFATTSSKPTIFAMPRGPVRLPGRPGQRPAKRTPIWRKTVQKPDPGLKHLAEESGGGYFELDDRDDLRATFARVAHELHRQYLLAIAPARLDGKVHELEVKVRRPETEARARKTYIAGIRK